VKKKIIVKFELIMIIRSSLNGKITVLD